MPKCCYVLLLIFFLFIIESCSKSTDIVSPSFKSNSKLAPLTSHQKLLGLFDISINIESKDIEIIPLRLPEFMTNIVAFLQPPKGNPINLKVKLNADKSDPPNGLFSLDISITHPFPGTNFRGFDVRAIVMGMGSQISQFDPDIQYPKPNELRLINADGYTRWWNPVEFPSPGLFGYTTGILSIGNPKCTVNGYKYYCDNLGPTDPVKYDLTTRGTFSTVDSSGKANSLTREHLIQFPVTGGTPTVQFRYAICASFLPPAPGTPPPAPVNKYPIDANCAEAFDISVSVDPSSTAYYNSFQAGGDLVLNIEIFDWQALENPDGISGEINAVRIESPTMWTGLIDPISSGIQMQSAYDMSSVWQVEIPNVKPASEKQDIFITVQSSDPSTYAPPGSSSAIYPGGAILAAYDLVTIVLPVNTPPEVGSISGPQKFAQGVQLEYSLSSMNDLQDGPNLKVTWDCNNDGNFNDDEDGSDTNKKGKFTFGDNQIYYIQCRITDTQGAFSDSNILKVEPISLPYFDPMDASTSALWKVENNVFGFHGAKIQWNIQTDHWSTSSPVSGFYEPFMDTMLISPEIPAGKKDTNTVVISHRFQTEPYWETCSIYYRINKSYWQSTGLVFEGQNLKYPDYEDFSIIIDGLSQDDRVQIGFYFNSDSLGQYKGWDITEFTMMDNEPPVIEGIFGPKSVNSPGPWTYSTIATDLDGISSYSWSVEPKYSQPIYDDPGDGSGNINITFPASGDFDIYVKATDSGNPPLSSVAGPYTVTVYSANPNAFYFENFDTDPGSWIYTGGISSGSYQDFWHIDTTKSWLSNVGPDGCYAESSILPIAKSAAIQVLFPVSTKEALLKIKHKLKVDFGGISQPWDGQWVTIDDKVVSPSYGYLYYDKDGAWAHGYFVGDTKGWVISTFVLGIEYNDGLYHKIAFNSYSCDTSSNCFPLEGWQIDYIELWLNE